MKNALSCLALMLFSSAALADGDVIIDIAGNTDDVSGSLARGSDGRLYAVGRANYSTTGSEGETYVMGLDSNGALIPGFGNSGKVVGEAGPVEVRSDGSVINGDYRVRTFNSAGTPLASFQVCGVFYPCSSPRVYTNSFLALPDGRAYSGGGEVFRVFQSSYWTFVRVNADGTPDTAFAGNPDGWVQKNGGTTTQIARMRYQSSTQLLALGWNNLTGELALSRFNVDGSTDFAFGTNGVLSIGTSAVFASTALGLYDARKIPLGVDQAKRILVPGNTNITARRLEDGSADNSYTPVPTDPQTSYLTFVVDSLDRVVVFGQRNGAAYVARLLANGGLDPSFGTGGETIYNPVAPGTSGLILTDGLVDASNRPILYFNVLGTTGARDIGLARLTVNGALDTTFGAGVPDADVYPDPITFTTNNVSFGTTGVISDPVTITGINAPTNISFVNLSVPTTKGLSVGCTGTYTTVERATVSPGQTVCVKHDASTTPGGSVTTQLNIGGRLATYTTNSTGAASDITPDPFTFADQAGMLPATTVISAPVTISGITGPAPIAIDFGQYSIGCTDSFRASPGTISNGQTVCVRVVASSSYATSVSAVLAINGVTDTFTATTVAADTTPAAFVFTSVADAPQNSSVMSTAITITGINAAAPVSVTGGRYAVNCDSAALTSQPGTITAGQFLCVEHTSAAPPGSSVTTTVTVGGYSTSFTSTTTGTLDTTPGAFPFPSLTNVAVGSTSTSAAVTISGINWPAAVTITGGEYSINCTAGAFTTQAGTVGSGQTICVRHTASSQADTAVTTTLNVGGVSSTFTSTTAPATSSGGGSSSSGSGGGGGGALAPRDLLALGIALLILRLWSARATRQRRVRFN